jgi:predicted nucleotidyltransferase component of viral defense system
MNNFVNLPQEEKEKYFINARDIIGINSHLIEKDFWVCWLLKKLFEIKNLSDYLTFKGGTSLSKVFKLIERFSEDVDLSIEKTFFGFINDKDTSRAKSNKARNKLLEDLKQKCGNFVRNDLIKLLEDKIKEEVKENWSLELDKDDPDAKTILFYYPSYKTKEVYVKPVVKIEMGARSEH